MKPSGAQGAGLGWQLGSVWPPRACSPLSLLGTTLWAELQVAATVSSLGVENELTSMVRKAVYRQRKPADNGVKKRELEV